MGARKLCVTPPRSAAVLPSREFPSLALRCGTKPSATTLLAVKTFWNGLFALGVLVALCMALALGVREFSGWIFHGVDPTVSAALVAAMATVLVSVLGVVLARYFERRRQIEVEIRERKVPMYKDMVQGLLDGLLKSEDGDTARFEAVIADLTPQLVTWASDDVIKAWIHFKRRAAEAEADPISAMFGFEHVLRAVRADLGHKSGNLAKGDLLGLFVNDIDEYLPSEAVGT